jgi:DNA-binding CsgD family transcriptional regulator
MSRSAKRSDKHLPPSHGKDGICNINSLLDISISIRELNDELDVCMKVNKLQFFDFAGYILERALIDQGFSSGSEVEVCNNKSSVNGKDKSLLDKIRRLNALSGRQRQIFEKLLMGRTNDQIADEMRLSTSTIKGHLQEVYLKLDVSNRYIAIIDYKDIYNNMKKVSLKK